MKKIIKKLLNKFKYFHINEIKNTPDYNSFLYGLLLAYKNNLNRTINIVQVGANDGVNGDPIHEFICNYNDQIKLLAIEPQKESYNRLKENYSKYKNIFFCNKAIGDGREKTFYTYNEKFIILRKKTNIFHAIKSHKIEENVDGYSSFEKEPLARKIKKEKKNPDEYIIQKNIKTYSLESVYSEFNGNFDNVDFLQIDAEGYDDEVIYNSSLENKKYKYINYEFKYFSEERLKKLHNYLHLNNYKIIRWKKSDELAYKENSI